MPEYIVGGTLIDGSGREPVPLGWLKIAAGRIDEVCTDPVRPLPPDARVVLDATGLTVMPGLVDAHCHLSYGDARNIEEQDLYGSAEYRAIRGTWHAGKVLRAGVTSVSDPGGSWQVAVAVRDAIRAGMFAGPRITAAGRYLTSHTGLADYFPAWVGNIPSGVGALTRTNAEMLDEIRRQVKGGVDFIKIAASGESPIMTPGGGSVPSFRREELMVMVDEAHRLGKRVTAHARSGVAVSDCIDAGLDWIMHGDYMTREQADKLAASGIPLCPALTLIANIAEWGDLCGVSPLRVERNKRLLETAAAILRYAHERGATLMCGTDSGFAVTPFGEWHAREMEIFVKYVGMRPLDAITCGTRNAAFAVDAANVGTLERGKFADVLAIDGDPLADIRLLQDKSRIRALFKEGAKVDLKRPPHIEKFPWERTMSVSGSELYYETVHGGSHA
jgi:imidazolonepropionase-like amidohydrolase